MRRHIYRILAIGSFVLPGFIPATCARPLLRDLTPFLMDGSNGFMHDFIFLAAPFVLP